MVFFGKVSPDISAVSENKALENYFPSICSKHRNVSGLSVKNALFGASVRIHQHLTPMEASCKLQILKGTI